ncbi:ABC-2 type transport system ATP-binding protein [Saccharopolyspora erythraea NRRL 2338]|nr:ABC-2 type transport system ATP-binding protein [Saccharopolyspora erythraea NRRL 2338]
MAGPHPRRCSPRHGIGLDFVSNADSPAVELRGLRKRFGGTVAVDGLDLRLERGHVLALLGPNGAGKTTTVEICEGFQRPDDGSVRVLGLDPAAQGEALRPRIGVMPQGGGAYPGVRADEMLRLVASCTADPLDPAWLLETLGLGSVGRTPYKRLSGGQQQRLSLACALVGRPELVFLDEPTAGMDPQARRLVWELVSALRRDGVSVLLTTHLMDEAEALADRVVIVDHGRAVAEGTAAELTAPEDGLQELRFRSQSSLELDLLLSALPEGCQATEPRAGEYVIRGVIDPQVVSTVTAWCARHGVLAQELRVGKRSLEDVFLELTGRELRS